MKLSNWIFAGILSIGLFSCQKEEITTNINNCCCDSTEVDTLGFGWDTSRVWVQVAETQDGYVRTRYVDRCGTSSVVSTQCSNVELFEGEQYHQIDSGLNYVFAHDFSTLNTCTQGKRVVEFYMCNNPVTPFNIMLWKDSNPSNFIVMNGEDLQWDGGVYYLGVEIDELINN